jgi:hypothetical protein
MHVHWILRSISGRLSQVKTFFLAMLSLKIDFSKKRRSKRCVGRGSWSSRLYKPSTVVSKTINYSSASL